jgi:hypothetical protein
MEGLYRVIVIVRQQFADSFPRCIAYKSAWLLYGGRMLDLRIVREMLSYINIDPIQSQMKLATEPYEEP